MKRSALFSAAVAVLAASALAACKDSTEPSLLSDDQVSEDLAISSAEAIATDVGELIANEVFFLPSPPASFELFNPQPPGMSVTRSRTCYDGQGQEAQCDPLTTASIVIDLKMNGSFSRTVPRPSGSDSVTVSASIHRTRTTTISGLLGQETSRTHDGVGTSNDTTDFTGATVTRNVAESALDSTIAVVFNLPRVTNPWPVSGRIVRFVNATITVTGARTETRTVSRRIEVIFPPDSQGNVTIHVGDKTCTLNLVTHRVVNCQG